MNYLILAYLLYIIITLALTLWVSRILSANGRIFLVEIFYGDGVMANAINRLMLAGFWLISAGYVVMTLGEFVYVDTMAEVIGQLREKTGVLLMLLGGIHFLNLFVLFMLRKRGKQALHLRHHELPNAE